MNSSPILTQSIVVSFSGLDGAGKTTQINALCEAAARLGVETELITFWDDVVVGKRYREGFVHKVFKSERGIGEPGRPVERRDKNVRAGYLTFIRHLLYLADAIHLRRVLSRARRGQPKLIITDRYIYDELANLPLENSFTRMFVRMVHSLVPRPNVAYLLDADPEAARARKPEYPVDFMHICRHSYFDLAQMLGNMTLIPPLPLSDAKREVEHAFFRALNDTSIQSDTKLDAAPAA
jgi:thymidylate kinase